MKLITPQLKLTKPWELDLAAMLAPLGAVTIPRDLIVKQANDEPLLANEREVLDSIPAVAHRLIQNIPRMHEVSQIVLYQNKNFDGSGYPKDEISGEQIPLGARVLRILSDLIDLETLKTPAAEIVLNMRKKEGCYDPHLLDLALGTLTQAQATVRKTISVWELSVGMVLAEDVSMRNGALLIRGGQIVSNTLKEQLRNYFCSGRIHEEVIVLAPADEEELNPKTLPAQTLISDDGFHP